MSKKKLAGIIVGAVCVIAVIVKIAVSIPDSPPTSQPDTEPRTSAEFTITDVDQSSFGVRQSYRVRITLLDFLRGEEAWTVLQERTSNEPPEPGFEYILVNAKFEFLESFPSDDSYMLSDSQFYSFSSDGERYDRPDAGLPFYSSKYPTIDAVLPALEPGESSTGWLLLQAAANDDTPLMSFAPEVLGYDDEGDPIYGSDGELWFRLYDDKSQSRPTPELGYDKSEPAGIGYPLSRWVYVGGNGGAPQEPVEEEWWSQLVSVHYEVKNVGDTHISYYKVWFTVTYEDGTQCEDWTNGTHLLPGERRSDYAFIKHLWKKAVTAEVSDYELTSSEIPEVMYEITGSAERVFVTLSNPTGGTEQHDYVYLPYRYAFTSFPESFVYISAQNQGDSGTVTVSIYVNGKRFKTSSSSGAYVIATASGLK